MKTLAPEKNTQRVNQGCPRVGRVVYESDVWVRIPLGPLPELVSRLSRVQITGHQFYVVI